MGHAQPRKIPHVHTARSLANPEVIPGLVEFKWQSPA